jgi:RNA polymerase sigma-70 factor (ECF subfamily)
MTGISVTGAIEGTSDVDLAADGDESAFARLIAAHSRAMVRVAFVIAGDWDVATDAVQVAWGRAWSRLPALRDRNRVEPWLVSIAANETRRLMSRQRRRSLVEIAVSPGRGSGQDPADVIELVDLRNALSRLHADDRALLAMRYIAGLDATQIGSVTGRSSSGVRSRLVRLLERLRKDLEHG